MSENVIECGYAGKLLRPRAPGDWDSIDTMLNRHGFAVNYEGTVVYQRTDNGVFEYTAGLGIFNPRDRGVFIDKAAELGFDVNHASVRFYVQAYYNGADCYMSSMTLDQFKNPS